MLSLNHYSLLLGGGGMCVIVIYSVILVCYHSTESRCHLPLASVSVAVARTGRTANDNARSQVSHSQTSVSHTYDSQPTGLIIPVSSHLTHQQRTSLHSANDFEL